MTLLTYSFDGVADGTAVTTANSGAALINSAGGGSLTFLSAAAAEGVRGIRCVSVSGQLGLLRFNTNASNAQLSVSAMLRVPALSGTNDLQLLGLRYTSGTNIRIIRQGATGDLRVYQSTTLLGVLLANASVTAAQYYRFTMVCNSTSGAYSVKVYPTLTSTTASGTVSGASGGSATTNAFTAVDVGIGSTTGAYTVDVDSLKMDDGSTSEIVPGANILPTVSVPGNQNVAAGATVNLTATGADSDGTIASYNWVVSYCSTTSPTLTGASTATVSFTAPAAGNLTILTCTVTDNSGGTATATVEVRVPTSSSTVEVLPGAGSNGAWTNTGGAATGGDALADALDTTYVESASYTGTESEYKQRLRPMVQRTGLTVYNRTAETVTGGTTKIRLYEGTTMRQEWSITQGTSAADESYTLTTPSAIVDWGNLYLAWAVNT